MSCEGCGRNDIPVFFLADPFALQVSNEVWMRWLCSPCHDDRYDDI